MSLKHFHNVHLNELPDWPMLTILKPERKKRKKKKKFVKGARERERANELRPVQR